MPSVRTGRALLLFLIFLLIIVLCIALVVFLGKQTSLAGATTLSVPHTEQAPAVLQESGSIRVHFCTRESCEARLAQLIASSISADCALYDLNLPSVVAALNATRSRLVIDNEEINALNNLSYMRTANRNAIMHNKFCVLNGSVVFTGSYNPVHNEQDDNNIVVIESPELARNYAQEFDELYGKLPSQKTDARNITIGGVLIENYFCPEDGCARTLGQHIRDARESVYFMTYSFTHPEVGTDLVLAHERGVFVRGVMEKTQESQYSRYSLFKTQGMDVRIDGNRHLMHHKVFIIDNETVVMGSFNPSKNADTRNDENILIIHDRAIASKYLQEFARVWAQAPE